jgi:hypothetical protein
MFSVPLPRAATELSPQPMTALPHCPNCGTELPVTAEHCYRCHTDLQTGQRLPWRQRLQMLSGRGRLLLGLSGAVLIVAALVSVQLYRTWTQPARQSFTPVTPKQIPGAQLATRLLGARDAGERKEALDALLGIEQRAAPAVAAALQAATPAAPVDREVRKNILAAFELLTRHAEAYPEARAEWCDTLARYSTDETLNYYALCGRARLGDARVLDELTALWRDRLKRQLLLTRLVEMSHAPADASITTRAAADVDRLEDGLRSLARAAETPVIERCAEAYWESWSWLGQGRGERFAEHVFALAKPARAELEFKPEDVRAARDLLKRAAGRGTPAARAAAGLILTQSAPQYQTLSRTIGESLGGLLVDATPTDRQRLTYTITRLRGNLFGSVPSEHPLDITAAEIAAALRWARPDGSAPSKAVDYPAPPSLVYRVTTASRLLEQDLLGELHGDWASAARALESWRAAGLGATPRVRALLSPGQRAPDYPALAAALVLVAEANDTAARPLLELWREASDQPAWVRAAAYAVLGSFDARIGRWDSRWPAGWDLGDPDLIEAGPGWNVFGRVLAAGGKNMLDRLTNSAPSTLSAAIKTKLSQAARGPDEQQPRPRDSEKKPR